MMDPKPVKRRKSRKKSSDGISYMLRVKELGCVVCGAWGPSDAHHVHSDHFGRPKSSDFATIPLCKQCHQTGEYAFHRRQATWEERNCKDYAFIPEALQSVYGDRWNIDH